MISNAQRVRNICKLFQSEGSTITSHHVASILTDLSVETVAAYMSQMARRGELRHIGYEDSSYGVKRYHRYEWVPGREPSRTHNMKPRRGE